MVKRLVLLLIISNILLLNITQISLHTSLYCDDESEQMFLVEKKDTIKIPNCIHLRSDEVNQYIKIRHFGNGTMELNEFCNNSECTHCSPTIIGAARSTILEKKICFVFYRPKRFSLTLKKWNWEKKSAKYFLKTYYKDEQCKNFHFSWGYPLGKCRKSGNSSSSRYKKYNCVNHTLSVFTESENSTCSNFYRNRIISSFCSKYDFSISACYGNNENNHTTNFGITNQFCALSLIIICIFTVFL
jgi:hypothetical protein